MLKGNDHGIIHSAKVVLLSAIIAQKKGISDERALLLLVAGVLHDIGRTGNCNDARHGERSVSLAKSFGYIIPEECSQIIKGHCRADKKERDLFLDIFKDADALDRVRTGDLDHRYLRTVEARTLIGCAEKLNELVQGALC